MSGWRLGLDLGGSKMLALVLTADGQIVGREKRQTKPERGYEGVLARLVRTVRGACREAGIDLQQLSGVGIGAPGPIDRAGGRILGAANLGWQQRPLAADLSASLGGLPVRLGNDVNCGALGEYRYGSGRGAHSVFAAFMGTGLGGGLILDGRVIEGAHGLAGEFGHIPGPFDQAACACGQCGCLETVASKRGIARLLAIEAGAGAAISALPGGRLKSSHLRRAWDDGCATTRRVLQRAGEALGWGLGLVTAVCDPQRFVLGGGILDVMGEDLLPAIRTGYGRYAYFTAHLELDLRPALLGADAVAIGAAELLLEPS